MVERDGPRDQVKARGWGHGFTPANDMDAGVAHDTRDTSLANMRAEQAGSKT